MTIDPVTLGYELPEPYEPPNPLNAGEMAYRRWLETGQTEPEALVDPIDPWPPEEPEE